MRSRYLEVTFRKGKPLTAYLYLPRRVGVKSVRTERVAAGLLVDYGPTDEPIGIEIIAPQHVTVDELNQVLVKLGQSGMGAEDFAPLRAA